MELGVVHARRPDADILRCAAAETAGEIAIESVAVRDGAVARHPDRLSGGDSRQAVAPCQRRQAEEAAVGIDQAELTGA
jgi:hypothetical protein